MVLSCLENWVHVTEVMEMKDVVRVCNMVRFRSGGCREHVMRGAALTFAR